MPNETKSTPTNVFNDSFLARFHRREEVHTVSEADHAGPWTVREVPGGFGVFREPSSEHAAPEGRFEHREHALLMAAVLPGLGRETLFHLDRAEHPEGFAVETFWGDAGNRVIGRLRRFEPELTDALHLAEALVRSPAALALLLEAAGATTLQITGEILARRMEPDEA